VGLITSSLQTPAPAVVEALNAIFDIYADTEYQYDSPVFVEMQFLKHLEAAVPGVRTMVAMTRIALNCHTDASQVKRIDRKKFPELRGRADEALMNLNRFIPYKKKEQAKQT